MKIYKKNNFNIKELSEAGYKINKKEVSKFLIFNPNWIKYYFKWIKTIEEKNKTTIDLEIPWFTYGAINWLNSVIKPDMNIFEYGSGGSTLYFAKKTNKVISIEHDLKWFKKMKDLLKNKKISNVELILIEGEKKNNIKKIYRSFTFKEYKDISFEKYVNAINKFPDNYFDIIVVDGRARVGCMQKSIKKLKNNGYLILDNSERPLYEESNEIMKNYKKEKYFGFGPFLESFWETTVWKKTINKN